MSEPVIVPPTPTITQPSGPVDTSPGLEQVQRAFDAVYPDAKREPAQQQTTVPPETRPPPPDTPPPTTTPDTKPPEELKIPSFLQDALKGDAPPAPPVVEPDAEFPEDLPQDQKQSRIKGLRDAYKKVKAEAESLRSRPARDPQEQQKLQWLENQNKQMAEMLSRVGVEHSAQFQQQIIAPLTQSWNEAARIVRDAGGDPQELAKVMSLQGKAQFEGLDMLFSDLPESAKMEAHDALRSYRRYEEARQRAVADAPRTLEAIRQNETQRQYQEISKQREQMQGMFERALLRLRDEAKVEVFQKTNDPDGKWWNDQSEQLVEQGRNLFLENTDLDRVALACLLAPAADTYRKMFLASQKKVADLQKLVNDRLGGEPNLSESAGSSLTPESQVNEDLKKPFADVFLREFHRSQSQRR
jgi:hypothetical protein